MGPEITLGHIQPSHSDLTQEALHAPAAPSCRPLPSRSVLLRVRPLPRGRGPS